VKDLCKIISKSVGKEPKAAPEAALAMRLASAPAGGGSAEGGTTTASGEIVQALAVAAAWRRRARSAYECLVTAVLRSQKKLKFYQALLLKVEWWERLVDTKRDFR
jgi:hypothetical protein